MDLIRIGPTGTILSRVMADPSHGGSLQSCLEFLGILGKTIESIESFESRIVQSRDTTRSKKVSRTTDIFAVSDNVPTRFGLFLDYVAL